MPTATKLTKEIEQLEQEMRQLRSLAISIVGEDPEGKYRPEFISEILKASQEKTDKTFSSKKQFLLDLKRS
jgi:hypothetical protein